MQSNNNTLAALKLPFQKMRAALIAADLKLAIRTRTRFTMPAVSAAEFALILEQLKEV